MQALFILDFPNLYDIKTAVPTRISDLVMEANLPSGTYRLAEGVWLIDIPEGYAFLAEVSALSKRANLSHHVAFMNDDTDWVHSTRQKEK